MTKLSFNMLTIIFMSHENYVTMTHGWILFFVSCSFCVCAYRNLQHILYSFLEGFPSSEMQTVKRLGHPAKQEDFGVAFGDAFAGHSVWEEGRWIFKG